MMPTILVVDDDADYLAQTQMMLASAGYTVVTADSVKAAKDLLATTRPDMAIVDLMLENADGGFQLCHHVKRLAPQTPVIIVTAVASETGINFGMTDPGDKAWIKADALLAKPVRFEQLQREIARLLKTPAAGER
jgi:CheY-like chemotaxis protein